MLCVFICLSRRIVCKAPSFVFVLVFCQLIRGTHLGLLLNDNPWVLPWKKKIEFSVLKLLFLLFTSLFTHAVKTVKTVYFSSIEKFQSITSNWKLKFVWNILRSKHFFAWRRTCGGNRSSYTRTFAQWRSRPLFQCRYKITETRAQALFLFQTVA